MESRLIVIVGHLLYNVVKQKEHNILILSFIEFSYEHIVLITQWYTWYLKPHNCNC